MKKVPLSFSQWLHNKYCRGCEIQMPCETCFVMKESGRWIPLVKEWFKEMFK
jgi:1-acyl-sn-glycerol-3-phosphate acyltransferase